MIRRNLLSLGLLAVFALCVVAPADEKVLYEKQSPYNAIVVTEDGRGLRTLSFDRRSVQSVVKVGDPDHLECKYTRVMPVGLALVEKPQRVLFVGLGGGSIPNFLHKHCPETRIDVVEIDAEVVAVAKKFFAFREDAAMHVYVGDGRRFIEECRTPYDIIFLDAYGPDSIPYALATREFLQAVRRALTPKGIAVANVWSRSSNPLYDCMVRTYQDVFEELAILDVQGSENKIFLAMPRQRRISQDDLARRARGVSTARGLPFDLGDVVTYGYREAAEKDPRARVLTDKNEKESTRESTGEQ